MKANVLPSLIALSVMAQLAVAAQDAQPADAPGPQATSASAGQTVNGPVLSLYHGEVQVLDLAGVTRIAVGNGEVLQATVVASNQVVLIGQAAGSTSLRVWTRSGPQLNYNVTVRAFDVSQIMRDVQDLLADEPGISARQVDGHVLIEGDYSSSKAASRLAALQKIYPQIVSTVPQRKPAATVAVDKMVYMDVRVVEIEKKVLRNLGILWAQKVSPALSYNVNLHQPGVPNAGVFGIAANLSSEIDMSEQAGQAWTLAEPTVSCKSGGEAKFTVGGEVPIPVANGLGTTQIVYHDYGVILEFKPVADDQGNISSTIVAEVSEPDASLSANGLVAFTKTRTETEVSLKENQTLVISGLLSNIGNNAANGIPGMKDVPVLGSLFKSKQYQNDRTELVIVVTPRAVSAGSELSTQAVAKQDEMQKRIEPTMTWINNRLTE